MKTQKIKFNDLHPMLLETRGYYGKITPGDIIEVDKKEFETKLKYKKNLNGELIYVPVTDEVKPAPKKEEPKN
jgi:hypothetical protein